MQNPPRRESAGNFSFLPRGRNIPGPFRSRREIGAVKSRLKYG